jgi:hypothetical protein
MLVLAQSLARALIADVGHAFAAGPPGLFPLPTQL